MSKPTLPQVRHQIADALRPIRQALLRGQQGDALPTATVLGYTFRGSRFYKTPGQTGYAWHPYFKADEPDAATLATHGNVCGQSLSDIASQVYHRILAAQPTDRPST